MSPFFAALVSLVLLESISLPCGEIRRSSLFGYRIERTGEVLDLEEAADAAELAAPTPPATKGEPSADAPPLQLEELAPASGPRAALPFFDAPANDLEVSSAEPSSEPCPCGGLDGGDPCSPCVDTFAAHVDATRFREEEPVAEEDLPPATATLCDHCKAGKRRIKDGCPRCLGRAVRVWSGNLEIVRNPPRTEPARIAAAYALADLLRDMPDTAIRGALELLGLALTGAEPATRTRCLEQWRFAVERRADEQQFS